MCKLVSGTLFLGAGVFHGYRVRQLWSFYKLKDKVFNVFALGVIAAIGLANYNAGYQIYLGQTMQTVEMRPSILKRLTGQGMELTP